MTSAFFVVGWAGTAALGGFVGDGVAVPPVDLGVVATCKGGAFGTGVLAGGATTPAGGVEGAAVRAAAWGGLAFFWPAGGGACSRGATGDATSTG
ncbi:MAG TPA: hypothetical protein VM925_28280, partial [Labilithrix sp.]|nr:hypothetical protein [Labilithrix sp.]